MPRVQFCVYEYFILLAIFQNILWAIDEKKEVCDDIDVAMQVVKLGLNKNKMQNVNDEKDNSNSNGNSGTVSDKSERTKISWASFLSGLSQISKMVLTKNNIAKTIKYTISNPLIVIFGIGDYDKNIMPSLIGVPQDYINCISTFLQMGYCTLYQTKSNQLKYIDTSDTQLEKVDLRQCKINAKTRT